MASFDIEFAAVTDIGDVFSENTNIVAFTELKYFTGIIEIPGKAFKGCSLLQKIILPESLISIDSNAFRFCVCLKSVIIPEGVASIGFSAFSGCSRLKRVYCKPVTPPAIYYYSGWGSSVDSKNPPFDESTSMKIYVPRDAYNDYMQYSSCSDYKMAQTNWYAYRSKIEAYDFEE